MQQKNMRFLRRLDPVKAAAVIWIVVLIGLLVPLLIIAKYNYPSADDFSYGIVGAQAIRQGGSLLDVFGAAAGNVAKFYGGWQGTYAAVFLMSLQPSIWGMSGYHLVPALMLVFYMGGTLFLLKVLFRNYIQADRWSFWLIGAVVLALSILTVPTPVEAFYWYNGAVFYVLFYGASLFLIGLLLLYYREQKPVRQGVYLGLSILLAALIGGGNYTTAVITFVVILLLLIYAAVKKSRRFWGILTVWLVLTAGLALSMAAPGNAVRQAAFAQHPSALQAIFLSFSEGVTKAGQWMSLPLLLGFLFLLPFLFRLASRSNFKFQWPLGVLLLSFCLFCAGFTPPLYAMGDAGPDRLLNIQYFAFCLLLLVDTFYVLGWLARAWRRVFQSLHTDAEAAFSLFSKQVGRNAFVFLFCMFLAIFASLGFSEDVWSLSSASAVRSLYNGEAKEYSRQMEERLRIFEDAGQSEVTLQAITVRPHLLFFQDVKDDADDWTNESLRNYYQKNSVRVLASEQDEAVE